MQCKGWGGLLIVTPSCKEFSLRVDGICDFLLTKGLWWGYMWRVCVCVCVCMIMFYRTVTSVLLGDTPLLPGFKKHCELPHGEGHEARNRGQFLAHGQQETEALSLAFCKEWNATRSHMTLEMCPAPVKPQWDHGPCWHIDYSFMRSWDFKQRNPLSCPQTPDKQQPRYRFL